jgi:hypothetical protein
LRPYAALDPVAIDLAIAARRPALLSIDIDAIIARDVALPPPLYHS